MAKSFPGKKKKEVRRSSCTIAVLNAFACVQGSEEDDDNA